MADHDYRKNMGDDALHVDKRAEEAAMKANVDNAKQRIGTTSYRRVEGKWVKLAPKAGMLPEASASIDHALARQEFFRDQMVRTDHKWNSLPGVYGRGNKSWTYQQQAKMLANYIQDANDIPQANQQYAMFAPLANMAYRSLMKTDVAGRELGMTYKDDVADELDKKETKALNKTVSAAPVYRGLSVSKASEDMYQARGDMVHASRTMANVLHSEVISKLRTRIKDAEEDKAEIQAKIARVSKIAGYIQTGASLVAGGAGKMSTLVPAVVDPSADKVPAPPPPNQFDKVKSGAESVKGGTGTLANIATMGMKLYYAEELEKLNAKIDADTTYIAQVASQQEANKLKNAHEAFKDKARAYRTAVTNFENALSDRRKQMALFGQQAGKSGGKGNDVENMMLWMTIVQESRAVLTAARTAGEKAHKDLSAINSSISKHRRTPYGFLEDVWSGKQRIEPKAADVQTIYQMRRLVQTWMEATVPFEQMLDEGVTGDGGIGKVMADAGYSGDY